MVVPKRRIITQGIDQLKASRWTERHADGNRTIELNDRGRCNFRQFGVESRDACPVGVCGSGGSGVAGGNRSLDRIRAALPAQLLGPFKRRKSTVDQ
jgi:hypothetical protein